MPTGLLSPTHLLLIGLIALLVFGPKRLPEIGRSLGHGLRGFKESVSGEKPEGEPDLGTTAQKPLELPQPNGKHVGEPAAHPLHDAQRQEHEVG